MAAPDFVAIDFETADPARDSACAVGLVRVEAGEVAARMTRLIRPPRPGVHPMCQAVHGLTWAMLRDQPTWGQLWPQVEEFLLGCRTLVAHNASFDRGVLEACCRAAGVPHPAANWVCTLKLSQARWAKPLSNKLPDVCRRLGVPVGAHHEAGADAEMCAGVYLGLLELEAGGAKRSGDQGGARVHPGANHGPGPTGSRHVHVADRPGRDAFLGLGGATAGGMAPEERILHLAGPDHAAAARRLINDATLGPHGVYLPHLLTWVERWAAQRDRELARSHPRCSECGGPGPGTWMCSVCTRCLNREGVRR